MDGPTKRVSGKHFRNDVVRLDATEFIDCEFDRCELAYGGGGLFVFSNSPVRNCEFVFDGAAENTLGALAAMFGLGLTDFVEAVFQQIRTPPDEATLQ